MPWRQGILWKHGEEQQLGNKHKLSWSPSFKKFLYISFDPQDIIGISDFGGNPSHFTDKKTESEKSLPIGLGKLSSSLDASIL
jgi:hypothetical protein